MLRDNRHKYRIYSYWIRDIHAGTIVVMGRQVLSFTTVLLILKSGLS